MKLIKPFFSIITCTLNSQKYLKKNIKSIERQTFKDFEQIFVDGFSNDKTVVLIKDYQKRHPYKVKFIQSKPRGISNAMNIGIKMAKGKYLIHLHSDDLFHDSRALEDAHKFLIEHPSYDWIYGKILVLKNFTPIGIFPDWLIFKISWSYLLKIIDFIPHQTVFIKKLVFLKYGMFDENNPSAMDYDLWLRIRNCTKWGYFDRIVTDFRLHQGSTSTSLANFEKHIKIRNSTQKKYTNRMENFIIWGINQWIDRGYRRRVS